MTKSRRSGVKRSRSRSERMKCSALADAGIQSPPVIAARVEKGRRQLLQSGWRWVGRTYRVKVSVEPTLKGVLRAYARALNVPLPDCRFTAWETFSEGIEIRAAAGEVIADLRHLQHECGTTIPIGLDQWRMYDADAFVALFPVKSRRGWGRLSGTTGVRS